MVKIVIIDDEKNVRIVLRKILNMLFSDCEIIGEAASVERGVPMIRELKPDIVLLDIELEDGTGFMLLEQLPKFDFKLIFITAFNEFAIKAFKVNALDYILKPIEPTELKDAIVKAKERINAAYELKQQLENINDPNHNTIVLKTYNNTHFIEISDILYCKADGAYTHVVTKKETVMASRNLKHFEEVLPVHKFIRTHQSYLVNKTEISNLKKNILIMKDGVEIPISVRKKAKIIEILGL